MSEKKHIFIPIEQIADMSGNQQVRLTFEDFCVADTNSNDNIFWWASDFMVMLGYSNLAAFMKPIQRAMQACLSVNIDCHDNFIKAERIIDGERLVDYKLTRFACYMVAMNSDIKKPEVAGAQVYFAKKTEQINLLLEGVNDVDRLLLRHEIKDGNKSLAAVAKGAGVVNFGIFQDSGYLGMYNMGMKKLLRVKGVDADLYDYMGKTELSANWFRITLTEEKLKARKVRQGHVANDVHRQVGSEIRKVVFQNTGHFPENLPIERKLGEIGKELKRANKQLNKKAE